jgi:hypothetical protein
VFAFLVRPAVFLAWATCGNNESPGREADVGVDVAADVQDRDAADSAVDSQQPAAPEVTAVPEAGDVSDAALASDLPAAPPDAPAEAAPDLPNPNDIAEAPTCTGICNAATPSYPVVDPDGGLGNITMYTTEASSGGACNYGATGVMYFAAVNVNVTPGDGRGHWQGGTSAVSARR